jgi:hypothetical protein
VSIGVTPSVDGLLLQGGRIDLRGEDYRPGTPVTFQMHSSPVVSGSLIADEHQAVRGELRIPFTVELGQHDLLAPGADGDGTRREDRLAVAVTEAPSLWVELALPLAGLSAAAGLVFLTLWRRTRRREAMRSPDFGRRSCTMRQCRSNIAKNDLVYPLP